jgi:uncharacterized membrane protein YczE
MKQLSIRIALALIGTLLLGLGAASLIVVNLGADTFSATNLGGSKLFGVSMGTFQMCLNIVIGIIVWRLDARLIGIGSAINIFLTGFAIDFWVALLGHLPVNYQLLLTKVLVIVIGLLIYSLGVALYTGSNIGAGSYDAIALVLSEKMKLKFIMARIIADSSFLVLGFVLGGPIGIVTFLVAICLGPLIHAWQHFFVNRILAKL